MIDLILSHNPLEINQEEIKNLSVISTWIDGKQVNHSIYTWKNFKLAVVNSVKTTSMVMILVASASAFGYMLTFYQVPSQMIELLYLKSSKRLF